VHRPCCARALRAAKRTLDGEDDWRTIALEGQPHSLDIDRGLRLTRRIEHYTSNRETKAFIVEQARLMASDVREKSGVWYRLNRWREEQIMSGEHPTYGDLVRQYIVLNKMPRFEKIPHGRYINFVANFLAADKTATRVQAIAAWTELKQLDVPKDYASWVKARAKRQGRRRG
jgi:hypothetical protein